MQNQTLHLLLLLGLLTAVSALESNLVKSFFSIPFSNGLSQPMIHTKNAVIAYSIEKNNSIFVNTFYPQFATINIEAKNATRIFEDTLQACGQVGAVYTDFIGNLYSRMYYHEDTETLVYYCTTNNSLLILDEDDYSVKSAIPTNVTSIFNETKLYTEGDSVVILGMGAFQLSEQLIFPQLIKIDLVAKKVVRQVTFNKNLGSGETVVAYSSTNLLSFVLTTSVQNYTTQVKIYASVFVGDFYTLTPITTFSYYSNPLILPDLKILGNYLVTNDNKTLLLYDIKGTLAYQYQGLDFLAIYASTAWHLPNFVMRHGSSSLYVLLYDGLYYQLTQLTSQGSNVTSKVVIHGALDCKIAFGNNQDIHDLAFFDDQDTSFFKITDIQTLETNYTANDFIYSGSYLNFSNSTYIAASTGNLYVFDTNSNLLLHSFTISGTQFYEEVNQVMYYLMPNSASSDDLMYFDIKTYKSGTIHSFTDKLRSPLFVDAGPTSDLSKPNLMFSYVDANNTQRLMVFTQANGAFNFTTPPNSQNIVPNYQTLSFFCFGPYKDVRTTINVTKYQYDTNTNTLELQTTYNRTDITYGPSKPLIIDEDTVVLAAVSSFVILHLSSQIAEGYTVPIRSISVLSNFKDNAGNNYIVFFDYTIFAYTHGPAYVFGPDKTISQLPGTDSHTTSVYGAGNCYYAVHALYDIELYGVSFYNVCSAVDPLGSNISIISQ